MWIKHKGTLVNLDNVTCMQRWADKIDLYVTSHESSETGYIGPLVVTFRFGSKEECDEAWEQLLLITNPITDL